ncbi:protein of unknown function [Nonomuraea solani]|uniref:Butirosin biosynthesis protein H, N-terminal n=1 Tax=Nonomuraea solani TaxID=1144553 RepID=A0A1H5UUT8_9ACTN|nr:BtrH N-terminal domain-containing protein [Nonomuraea solani]SEF78902.1 protein of unknown function [Nonomuraea solani]
MTGHKHLKRRVRDRMAKTGESYTTALRHVAGRARHHHESALLRHVLGGGHSEAMLLGLGGGIGFMYFVFEYQGHPPMLTIVAQAHPAPMIPLALTRAGAPHEIRRTGSAKVAERNLRAALDAGRQPMCRVARHLLPWRDAMPFPDPVDVAVTGLSGDVVRVRDDATADLPLKDFLAAWSAVPKEKHQLIEITGPAAGEPDVAGAIADTAAKLTGPVLGNAFDVNFGLSGMRKLAAQLADTKGKQGWTRRFADPGPLLDRLSECLEVEYTAPGATRPLYADFLAETGRAEAAAVYREAGGQWSRVAVAAAAHTPPPELAAMVADAVLLEERGVALLR